MKVFNSSSRTISNVQLTPRREDESINDDEEEPNDSNCSSTEPFPRSRASKKKSKKATDIQMGIDVLKALCEDKNSTTAKLPQEKNMVIKTQMSFFV